MPTSQIEREPLGAGPFEGGAEEISRQSNKVAAVLGPEIPRLQSAAG